jgi:hypothetical protein
VSEIEQPDEGVAADRGDDTARRFRYQWTYAATVCCTMLDPDEEIEEVFCEQHEDILVKTRRARFRGLQIKTKDSGAAWKCNDEAVKSSLVRFCKLEAAFPDAFERFEFLTNHSLHDGGNGQDLGFVLRTIRDSADMGSVPAAQRRFLESLSRSAACTAEVAFQALRKTRASDQLPKIRDVQIRLVDTLPTVWPQARELQHDALKRAANNLIAECQRASSLAHEGELPSYMAVTENPTARELAQRLANKRIDRARLLRVLEDGVSAAASLDGAPELLPELGLGSPDLLASKLDAGGFSSISRNSAMDLRDKAEYLAIGWTKKLGREGGLQRYSHVRSLVWRDAARAYEAAKSKGDPFGAEMLDQLRQRLEARRAARDMIYDCSVEHLEGFAFSLTSECKVDWSLARPWEAE